MRCVPCPRLCALCCVTRPCCTRHGITLPAPAVPCAPAGPRIGVGTLSKDTGEQDVKDHFMRFGFVLDVYLPRGEHEP